MNEEKPRERLFGYLDSVLKVSEEKFKTDNRKDPERRSWGRLLVHAVTAYGKLLDTEELEERIEKLEEQLKTGVLIPDEKSKQKSWQNRRKDPRRL